VIPVRCEPPGTQCCNEMISKPGRLGSSSSLSASSVFLSSTASASQSTVRPVAPLMPSAVIGRRLPLSACWWHTLRIQGFRHHVKLFNRLKLSVAQYWLRVARIGKAPTSFPYHLRSIGPRKRWECCRIVPDSPEKSSIPSLGATANPGLVVRPCPPVPVAQPLDSRVPRRHIGGTVNIEQSELRRIRGAYEIVTIDRWTAWPRGLLPQIVVGGIQCAAAGGRVPCRERTALAGTVPAARCRTRFQESNLLTPARLVGPGSELTSARGRLG